MATKQWEMGMASRKVHSLSGTSTTKTDTDTTIIDYDAKHISFEESYKQVNGVRWKRFDDPDRRDRGDGRRFRRNGEFSGYSRYDDRRRDWRDDGRRFDERNWWRRDERRDFDEYRRREVQTSKKRVPKIEFLKSKPFCGVQEASEDEIIKASEDFHSFVETDRLQHIKVETEEEKSKKLQKEKELAKNLAERQRVEQQKINEREQRIRREESRKLAEKLKHEQIEERRQLKDMKKERRKQKNLQELVSLRQKEAEELEKQMPSTELALIQRKIKDLEYGLRMMEM